MLDQAVMERPAPVDFVARMRAAKEAKRRQQHDAFPDEGEAFEPSQDVPELSEALGGHEFPLPAPIVPGKAPNQMKIIRTAFLLNQSMKPKELARMLAEQGHDFKLTSIAAVVTDARSVVEIMKELGLCA